MASTLRFRNLNVSPDDPVETWPFEGILAALERGTLPDWRRIVSAIEKDPWGPVARQVEEAISMELPSGVAPLFRTAIARSRAQAVEDERRAVAAEISVLLARSGLRLAELAERTGTSASRFSTYRSGKVTPSAAMLVRIRNVVERIESARRAESTT